jgi:nicotinate-nucleotide pyrophosphorylase (carboxylating)
LFFSGDFNNFQANSALQYIEMKNPIQFEYQELISRALREDVGSGDITSAATIDRGQISQAVILCKQDGILAGVQVAIQVFRTVDADLQVIPRHKDKDPLKAGESILGLKGRTLSILQGERVALNFLSHLSGIATLTNKFVEQVKGLPVKITDTRKTIPLWRNLQKQAVLAGGGYNHRMGLYDMVLIKENHIRAAKGICRAVAQARDYLQQRNLTADIEVETTNIDEVHEALTCRVNRIMLDNMTIPEMAEAVKLINRQVEVEASGGVNLDNVRAIAETGVTYISIGALTHSVQALDFSLLIEE